MDKEEACRLFKLLGDENRLKICKLLYLHDEMCACQFEKHLHCKQATISHHMKLLVEVNLVHSQEEGKWVHYSLNKAKLKELLSFFDEKCQCARECVCGE